jgi:hypothetical protein
MPHPGGCARQRSARGGGEVEELISLRETDGRERQLGVERVNSTADSIHGAACGQQWTFGKAGCVPDGGRSTATSID